MKYYFKLLLKKTDDQRKIKEEHRDIPHCGRGQLTARGPRRGQLSRGFGPRWQLRAARWRGVARRDLRPGVFGRSLLPSSGPAGSHPARYNHESNSVYGGNLNLLRLSLTCLISKKVTRIAKLLNRYTKYWQSANTMNITCSIPIRVTSMLNLLWKHMHD